MDISLSKISISEMYQDSDFWNYLFIIIQGKQWSWIIRTILIRIFWKKKSTWFIIKREDKIIGGFLITNFPIIKYKPFNLFNFKAQKKIEKLRDSGYLNFCCFIIAEKYQNQWIGSYIFNSFFKKENPSLKIFFTATKKAISFYLRQGVKISYPGKYTIYTFE
jgi:hypothetical protein